MHSPANHLNPFKQSSAVWVVELNVPFAVVEQFIDHLSAFADSVSCFEEIASASFESRPTDIWKLQLYAQQKPDETVLKEQVALLAASVSIPLPAVSLHNLPDHDWVSQVQENFPPLHIGRYFIHGSHYKGTLPHASYALEIDAGRAFGTGEHETTSACLEAITWLAKRRRFHHVLDMGCGSGILAIAMAATWRSHVTAVDIDEQAVHITYKNAALNRVLAFMQSGCSNGYHSRLVKLQAPYDLIVSNILAKPLVAFAPDLARNLEADGFAVLSGLLKYQEPKVLAAHVAQGLKLVKRIERNSWSTLILQK